MERMIERQLLTEDKRATAEGARLRKEREREQRAAERGAKVAEAERRTEELAARVVDLEHFLRACAQRAPLSVADVVCAEPVAFDPGRDGVAAVRPRDPVPLPVGLFQRRKIRRWNAQERENHQVALERYEAEENARHQRLARRRAAHESHEELRRADDAVREARLVAGLGEGRPEAVAEFVREVIGTLPLPDLPPLLPEVVYRRDPREVVMDVRLPDESVVPSEKTVSYVQTRDATVVKERPVAEREAVYRRILAQLPLAVADIVLRSLGPDLVDAVAVNGKLEFADPTTGQLVDDYMVSLRVSREEFAGLTLASEALDPVRCVKSLKARLSNHPLARETVPAFLTFDEAKYKLGSPVDVAAGLDGRPNLGTMPWQEFEQLVRELLLAMHGNDTRVTRRSRDDGIDGVMFDCDATVGGEYVVQAKRYTKVVPAGDVRALAGTMHDKRANHALFVTTSWFSPDGRRFAKDNRVRLIEGPELRHLLLEHLQLDVLIPEQRSRGTGTSYAPP